MKIFNKDGPQSASDLEFPDLEECINQEINREINEVQELEVFTSDELSIINHYMTHGDESKAYRAVLAPNVSKNNLRPLALSFFSNPKIVDEVKRRQTIILRNHLSLVEQIIKEYKNIALANMDDFGSWSNYSVRLKPSDQLTRAQKAAVCEVKSTLHGPIIKLHKKMDGLRDLSKILQLLHDTLDLTSSDGSQGGGTVLILPDNHREFDDD